MSQREREREIERERGGGGGGHVSEKRESLGNILPETDDYPLGFFPAFDQDVDGPWTLATCREFHDSQMIFILGNNYVFVTVCRTQMMMLLVNFSGCLSNEKVNVPVFMKSKHKTCYDKMLYQQL